MSLAASLSNVQAVTLPKGGEAERVDKVQLDGLVVLKILKHARENPFDNVSGPLLGLVSNHALQVTNCFPFPDSSTTEDPEEEQEFQKELLKRLRDVNVDHLEVGWYQSSFLGCVLTEEIISVQFDYQTLHEESVILIYDPIKTAQGSLAFSAFRLTQQFMKMYKAGDFTPKMIKTEKLSFDSVFEQVPVELHTSHLAQALITELDDSIGTAQGFDHLDLGTHSFLEHNVRKLMDCVDELSNETQKYNGYQRKLQQQRYQMEQKLKVENVHRQEQGLAPLRLDEDSIKLPPPSRLDSLLISGQINHYCEQIAQFASQSFGKLFVAQGLQEEESS